jgi:hypothetical protein
MSDLSQVMQARLDAWRKSTLQVKSAEKIRGPSQSKCRMVRGDYGDDIRDYQEKEAREWSAALQNDTINRKYR